MTEEAIVVYATGEHAIALDALLVDGALRVAGAQRHATAFRALVTVIAVAVLPAGDRHADAFRLG